MAKRRKEEAQETRERILDAAITVFHEHGVARPSLTEVAERAGVTRGAVYGHFRNKADVVTALTARISLPADSLCEADAESCRNDPLGELRTRWLNLFHEVARNRQWQLIFEIIFHRVELVTESGEIRDRVIEGHGTAIQRITKLLEQSVAVGQLPAGLDVRMAAPLLHGALIGVLQDWLLQPDAYDLATIGERNIDALLDMLRLSPTLRGESVKRS
ncbi:MAG TPA: TetR family transcriptional regulator [Gammaproteobacteria bacterium]